MNIDVMLEWYPHIKPGYKTMRNFHLVDYL